MLSYIEIWENTGDPSTPNYLGTLLNGSDDHPFDDEEGEIRKNQKNVHYTHIAIQLYLHAYSTTFIIKIL